MKKAYIWMIVLITFFLAGCSNHPSMAKSHNNMESKVISDINKANYATLKRNFSFKKSYTAIINKKKYKLNGKFANILGETITMTRKDKRILYEDQKKRFDLNLNRMATIYDDNEEVIGYLGEDNLQDIISLTRKYHIYDKEGVEIAKVSGKLSFPASYEVTDMDDNKIYLIHKKLGFGNYNIRKLKETEVPLTSVILVTCILDNVSKQKHK